MRAERFWNRKTKTPARRSTQRSPPLSLFLSPRSALSPSLRPPEHWRVATAVQRQFSFIHVMFIRDALVHTLHSTGDYSSIHRLTTRSVSFKTLTQFVVSSAPQFLFLFPSFFEKRFATVLRENFYHFGIQQNRYI